MLRERVAPRTRSRHGGNENVVKQGNHHRSFGAGSGTPASGQWASGGTLFGGDGRALHRQGRQAPGAHGVAPDRGLRKGGGNVREVSQQGTPDICRGQASHPRVRGAKQWRQTPTHRDRREPGSISRYAANRCEGSNGGRGTAAGGRRGSFLSMRTGRATARPPTTEVCHEIS